MFKSRSQKSMTVTDFRLCQPAVLFAAFAFIAAAVGCGPKYGGIPPHRGPGDKPKQTREDGVPPHGAVAPASTPPTDGTKPRTDGTSRVETPSPHRGPEL